MAEGVGFELTVEFPRHTLSKRAPSTTRTPLHRRKPNQNSTNIRPVNNWWFHPVMVQGDLGRGCSRTVTAFFWRKPRTRARIRFTLLFCEPDLRCPFLFHAWVSTVPADTERALLKI